MPHVVFNGLEQEFQASGQQMHTQLFRRLLREEIRVYASSEEETDSEIRDLFRFAAGT